MYLVIDGSHISDMVMPNNESNNQFATSNLWYQALLLKLARPFH
jgi:hypothetical protein